MCYLQVFFNHGSQFTKEVRRDFISTLPAAGLVDNILHAASADQEHIPAKV